MEFEELLLKKWWTSTWPGRVFMYLCRKEFHDSEADLLGRFRKYKQVGKELQLEELKIVHL